MTAQNETKKPIVSKMYFLERAQWRVGEDVFTVVVGEEHEPKSPVGYIKLERYDDNKKGVFSSRDPDGNELFETTIFLFQLKRKFFNYEKELTQAMNDRQLALEEEGFELLKNERRNEIQEVHENNFDKEKGNRIGR